MRASTFRIIVGSTQDLHHRPGLGPTNRAVLKDLFDVFHLRNSLGKSWENAE